MTHAPRLSHAAARWVLVLRISFVVSLTCSGSSRIGCADPVVTGPYEPSCYGLSFERYFDIPTSGVSGPSIDLYSKPSCCSTFGTLMGPNLFSGCASSTTTFFNGEQVCDRSSVVHEVFCDSYRSRVRVPGDVPVAGVLAASACVLLKRRAPRRLPGCLTSARSRHRRP